MIYANCIQKQTRKFIKIYYILIATKKKYIYICVRNIYFSPLRLVDNNPNNYVQ